MPEGLKKFFWRPFPTPSLRSGWLGPPLSPGLDLALSDTKYHKILRTLSLNRYAMWWFFINVLLLSWEIEKKLCFTTLNLAVKNLGTGLERKQSYFSVSGQNGRSVTKAHQGLLQTIRPQVTDYNLFLYLLFLSDLYQQTLVLKQHL